MRIFLAGCAIAASVIASANDAPLWLRNTVISPDGTSIAFTYRGDIYTVSVDGGRAHRITAEGYNTLPKWSPDSKQLAFSSDRNGSDDIYIVDAVGGTPKRLTTHSGSEAALAWLNDSTIIFRAAVMPDKEAAVGSFQASTYTVGIDASRPRLLFSLPAQSMSVNGTGDILYRDRKGYEDPLRKHERSSATSDIRLLRDGKFTQLTATPWTNSDPVWGEGDNFYYLSEEANDNLNVYYRNIAGSDVRQLTTFTTHPVRSLSATADGKLLAFSWNGEIYTLVPGAQPVKVNVTIAEDLYDVDRVKNWSASGATAIAVSPEGKELAFVKRGEVYVTSVEYETTKRITDTPGQERCIHFAPNGRSIVYDSERDGKWQLFISKIKNDDDKLFTYASEVVEVPLYSCETTAQQPEFSPDGKKVAFLENRTILRVIDVESKQVTTVLDGNLNYSYADGDITFHWSPDSRWLVTTYMGEGGWNNTDIAITAADGTKVVDLTESGYAEGNPRWALDGKAVTYESGRYGYKNQASWGEQTDIFLMALDGEAWDNFNRTKEEVALAEEAEEETDDADDDNKDKKGKKDKKAKKGEKDADKDVVIFDLANLRYRVARITVQSGFLGDYVLDPKGENLYYTIVNPEGSASLMRHNIRENETSSIADDVSGGFELDKDGENLFVISSAGISKIALPDGKQEAVKFNALYTRTPSAERAQIYDHMLSQVEAKFYDEKMHGVDWHAYGEAYRRFLPYISNSRDFAELMSEILGELNASHTGGRAYTGSSALPTASLGAFFDDTYTGAGLKVAEVLPRGPLSTANANVKPGEVIKSIDGVDVESGADYFPLLEGKAGKKVALEIIDVKGAVRKVIIKPTSQGAVNQMLYHRWVEHNQALVDSLSDGRLAYVHVKGMDSESYRVVYQELLGRYRNCEGVVVDTRFNGGGWLHNDLMILLSGREYMRYEPRGRYIGSEPWSQWTKPSIMLVNEGNYSDASGTPEAYRALGIGEVVGAPIAGTMTAVWWETQIDPSLVFGIPQVTNRLKDGSVLENKQFDPDIVVYNTPDALLSGTDEQLEAAVARLLQTLQ